MRWMRECSWMSQMLSVGGCRTELGCPSVSSLDLL